MPWAMPRYCLGRVGWPDDLRHGRAMARSADPLSYAAVVAYVYWPGMPIGGPTANDAAVGPTLAPFIRPAQHATARRDCRAKPPNQRGRSAQLRYSLSLTFSIQSTFLPWTAWWWRCALSPRRWRRFLRSIGRGVTASALSGRFPPRVHPRRRSHWVRRSPPCRKP